MNEKRTSLFENGLIWFGVAVSEEPEEEVSEPHKISLDQIVSWKNSLISKQEAYSDEKYVSSEYWNYLQTPIPEQYTSPNKSFRQEEMVEVFCMQRNRKTKGHHRHPLLLYNQMTGRKLQRDRLKRQQEMLM